MCNGLCRGAGAGGSQERVCEPPQGPRQSPFGQDVRVLVARQLAEQLPDGRWNCAAADGVARSSFKTTIFVLEALLACERDGGGHGIIEARLRGQEYLLERRLLRRRSTGEVFKRDGGGSVHRRGALSRVNVIINE